jgi:hypothetical protein
MIPGIWVSGSALNGGGAPIRNPADEIYSSPGTPALGTSRESGAPHPGGWIDEPCSGSTL